MLAAVAKSVEVKNVVANGHLEQQVQ